MFARLLALLLLMAVPLPIPAMEIIGHRGASFDAPENTLASFRQGWAQGADADELDIYLTKDGQIVVIHDSTTKRTTGVDRRVDEQTLEEIRAQDAGSWKGPAWQGERIPTLAEVLALIPAGRRLFIEIKCGSEVLPELERVLAAAGDKRDRCVLIGFHYEVMAEAQKRFPTIPAYWLASVPKSSPAPALDELLARAKAAGLAGLDLDWHFPIDADFVRKVEAAGQKVYTWTVDDPAVARRLRDAGIHGITTNRPGWMREQLR